MLRILGVVVALLFMGQAMARDTGQWEDSPPETREWFRNLMMPDAPKISCCGEADAYWCDGPEDDHGKMYCIINDDRDNDKLHRRPIPNGTRIDIPDFKLKWDEGNPTGHAIVFVGNYGVVYCFVMNSGV